MGNKIENDKYYTPIDIANYCIDKTIEIIGLHNIKETIEPSVGNGSFLHNEKLLIQFGYDIEPDCIGNKTKIIKDNFLTTNLQYKEGRLFIGNPPFGTNSWGIQRFYNRCCELGDYIAFILPISQLNNPIKLYQFDLIYSEDLGIQTYTDRELHCCFNIYKRPQGFNLNPKPNFTLKDITIIEHRRKKGDYNTAKNKEITLDYDYAMCNWGSGCLGKVPEYVGQYAQEVYFYCHNKKYLEQMLNLLEFNTIRNYCNSISMKKISVMRLYKYLKDNIEGIE